jgi:tryptophan-rich sensory protein
MIEKLPGTLEAYPVLMTVLDSPKTAVIFSVSVLFIILAIILILRKKNRVK